MAAAGRAGFLRRHQSAQKGRPMMKRRWLFLSLVLVLALLPLVLASANQGFGLSWSTVDGGGGTFSTGGSYSLGGTVGQPDAGVMTGGSTPWPEDSGLVERRRQPRTSSPCHW